MIERLHVRSDRRSAAPLSPGADAENSSIDMADEFSEILRQQGSGYQQVSGADLIGLAIAQASLVPVGRPQSQPTVVAQPQESAATIDDQRTNDSGSLEARGQTVRLDHTGPELGKEEQRLQITNESGGENSSVEDEVAELDQQGIDKGMHATEKLAGVAASEHDQGPDENVVAQTVLQTETSPSFEGEPKPVRETLNSGSAAKIAESQPASKPSLEETEIEVVTEVAAEVTQAQFQTNERPSAQSVTAMRRPGADFEFVPDEGTTSPAPTQGIQEASAQLLALRQAFEQLRGQAPGDRSNPGLSGQSKQPGSVSGVMGGAEPSSVRHAAPERASRPLTKAMLFKAFERVESALKEVAKSKDGKTLSVKLDPVNLGKVKVDVTLRDGGLHARIIPENQQVLVALRERAHELQASLRKLGLDVDTVTVAVSSESNEGLPNGSFSSGDGKSYQEQWSNLPGQGRQVVETTIGNEIAERISAGTDVTQRVADEKDHWVA